MPAPHPTIIASSISLHADKGRELELRAGPAFEYACRLARCGSRPRICVIPTAGGEQPQWLAATSHALGRLGLAVTHLLLFPMPNIDDFEEHLCAQDVIWVPGGSTANLLALWRLHGLDRALHAAWQAGVVLMGCSAGSICWHRGGTTDSFGLPLLPLTNGLGFIPYSNSPHYDAEPERRPLYQRLIADGTLDDGYATDDGAGLVYRGTELHEVISERDGALGYELRRDGESACERALPTRVLGDGVTGTSVGSPRTRWVMAAGSPYPRSGPAIVGLDHVQIAAPPGCEAEARRFFGELLGLEEVEKPEPLRSRGGVWFQLGRAQLHVGVEREFSPATKAHPALRVAPERLQGLAERLLAAGAPVSWDAELATVRRFYTADPWGNRLELLSAA